MSHYHFIKPILRKSRKKIAITDSNGNKVGSIQRVYNGALHFVFDNIFDEFWVNVEVFNEEEKPVSKASEVFSLKTMVRSEWIVFSDRFGKFLLRDRTKIKSNPCLEFTIKNNVYQLKKDFADKVTRLEKSTNEIIALVTYDKLVPPQTITIEIFNDEMDVYTLSCIYYLFTLRD
ncbi:tubby C-terminal domain-like protein [Paenibacillus apiarius]|uniref:tubby C-terminal domain-like protein n=1 Tax=Paenibacillus apiarius TaxID=46240 RepID=UPI003B3A0ADF